MFNIPQSELNDRFVIVIMGASIEESIGFLVQKSVIDVKQFDTYQSTINQLQSYGAVNPQTLTNSTSGIFNNNPYNVSSSIMNNIKTYNAQQIRQEFKSLGKNTDGISDDVLTTNEILYLLALLKYEKDNKLTVTRPILASSGYKTRQKFEAQLADYNNKMIAMLDSTLKSIATNFISQASAEINKGISGADKLYIKVTDTKRNMSEQYVYYVVSMINKNNGDRRINNQIAKIMNDSSLQSQSTTITTTLDSLHLKGLAIDIQIVKFNDSTGKVELLGYVKSIYDKVITVANSLNLIWGGTFQDFFDYPHFQLKNQ